MPKVSAESATVHRRGIPLVLMGRTVRNPSEDSSEIFATRASLALMSYARTLASAAPALLLALAGAGAAAAEPAVAPTVVTNFALLDADGRYRELGRAEAPLLVLFVTGNGCPIA